MSGTVNRILAQEDLEVDEGTGAGTSQKIFQDNKVLGDRENAWAPSELDVTGTVAGRHNPVAASPASSLNEMMQGINLGQENARGVSKNGGGTSGPPPIS